MLQQNTSIYIIFSISNQGVPDLSDFGDAYDFVFGLGQDQPPTSAVVKKDLQRKIIYHMSPSEVTTTN